MPEEQSAPACQAATATLRSRTTPNRTDDEVDAMVAGFAGASIPVSAAAEGAVLTL